jgi:hypothetical protein
VQFLLGTMQTGPFRFLFNVEAVTDTCPCPASTSPGRSGPPRRGARRAGFAFAAGGG